MSTAAELSWVLCGCCGLYHTPAGTPLRPPVVMRSGMLSPERSWSAWTAVDGLELIGTLAACPMLPPAERLLTVSRLVKRRGVMVAVALPLASAATLTGGPPLSWYR